MPPPQGVDLDLVPATGPFVGAWGPFRRAYEEYRGAPIDELDEAGLADRLRAAGVVGVVHAWDAASATGCAPVTNDDVAAVVARHPEAFAGAASVDPRRGVAAVAEFRRAVVDLGLVALALDPVVQGFDLADPACADLCTAAVELDVPLLVRVGAPAFGAGMRGGGGLRLAQGHPLALDDLAAAFPELPIVALGTGAPWTGELLAVAAHKRNVVVGLSGDPTGWPGALADAVRQGSLDGAVAATGDPGLAFGRWLDGFRALRPPAEFAAAVAAGNAARLLELA